MEKFDVIIAGGGPGGASAAIYLRQKGISVCVLEKAKMPRDHVGESLIPFCYHHLSDLGVMDEIQKFSARKPGVNFVDKDGKRESVWCFDKVIQDGASMSFHTLRAPFDHAILKQAVKDGAVVLEEHVVKNVDLSVPQQATVTYTDKNGTEYTAQSRFFVDATGQDSFLAKKLNMKKSYSGLERTALFSHWINTNYDAALKAGIIKIVYLGGEKKGWIWVIPVGRNHISIGVTLNNSYVRERKKEINNDNWKEILYRDELSQAVALDPILRDAQLEHAVQIIGDYSYFAERKSGSNYVTIGDAGAFLDPIFSSGILLAFETAKQAAHCIDIALRQGEAAGREAFSDAEVRIKGGYNLAEKFVRLFYDNSLLNFSHVSVDTDGFNRFMAAYEIFHYLLSGDFFSNYGKYSEFLDTLTKERNFNQFISYVKQRAGEYPDSDFCRYDFEEVYGHLPPGDQVAPGLLAK